MATIRVLSIDLGTSNTVVYQFSFTPGMPDYNAPGAIEIRYPDNRGFPIQNNNTSFPSVLYLDDESGETIPYCGAVAQQLIVQNPGKNNQVFNTKRLMGSEQTFSNGYTAEKVAEEFFNICCYSAGESRLFRSPAQRNQISHICVTRPAAFDPYGIDETARAAAHGVQHYLGQDTSKIVLVEEPQAALLSFLYERLSDPDLQKELLKLQKQRGGSLNFAVVDIGGGTTDVTVQRLKISGIGGTWDDAEGQYWAGSDYVTGFAIDFINRKTDGRQSISTANRAFGGMDFDEEAAAHLIDRLREVCMKKGFDIDRLSDEEKESIRNLATVNAKEYKDSFRDSGNWAPNLHHLGFTEDVLVTYTRKEYISWIFPLIGSHSVPPRRNRFGKELPTIYKVVQDTLDRANYKPGDLDYMYVTGGMSLYPPVREMLRREFGDKTRVEFSNTALEDIARGAALYNSYFRIQKDVSVLSENLMIDRPTGPAIVMARAGEALPAAGTIREKDGFVVSNPVEMTIDILMGSSPLSPNMHKIKTYRVDIPMTRIGTPIEIDYKVSEQQKISLTLRIKDSKNQPPIEINQD